MLELSTIGIKFYYAEGTKPATGANPTVPTGTWTEIENVTSIGEISASPDQLEVSNLKDTWKRFIAGIKSGTDNLQIGANFTKDFQAKWSAAVSQYATAFAAEKPLWWKVEVPNFGYFAFTGEPITLGLPGIEVNQVFAGNTYIIPNYISGWTMESDS